MNIRLNASLLKIACTQPSISRRVTIEIMIYDIIVWISVILSKVARSILSIPLTDSIFIIGISITIIEFLIILWSFKTDFRFIAKSINYFVLSESIYKVTARLLQRFLYVRPVGALASSCGTWSHDHVKCVSRYWGRVIFEDHALNIWITSRFLLPFQFPWCWLHVYIWSATLWDISSCHLYLFLDCRVFLLLLLLFKIYQLLFKF